MEGDTASDQNKDLDIEIEAKDATSVVGSDLTSSATGVAAAEEEVKQLSEDSIPIISSYQIKPSLHDKFKANPVKEVIRHVLTETLTGQTYDSDSAKEWTIKIANDVNTRVRELKMKRYKHIAQVIMGELKGAGVKCGVRCLWDSETDGYTSDVFMNDSIFCVTVVFAIYLY